jgi:hypothetical protein
MASAQCAVSSTDDRSSAIQVSYRIVSYRIVTVRNIESCPVNSSFGSIHPSLTGLLFTPCSGPAGHRRRCRHGRHRRTGVVGGVFTVKRKGGVPGPYPGRHSIRFTSLTSHVHIITSQPLTLNSICKPKFLPNTSTCNSAHKKSNAPTYLPLTTGTPWSTRSSLQVTGLERSLCFA